MSAINTSGFLPSAKVVVYPCAYRDSSADLKSKINLEENIVRSALYGSSNHNTYIVKKDDTKLACFIKGYYFELTYDSGDLANYTGIRINLATTTDDYKTTVLTPFGGSVTDTVDVLDNSNNTLYFKALQFIKSGECDLYFEESKNVKPISYKDICSTTDSIAIAGNLVASEGTNSIIQNGTGNVASGENSVAIGKGNSATEDDSLVIGKFANGTGKLFAVGCGTSASSKGNAFSVDANGTYTTGTSESNIIKANTANIAGTMTCATATINGATAVNGDLTAFTLKANGKATCGAVEASTAKVTSELTVAKITGTGAISTTSDISGKNLAVVATITAGGMIKGASFYATSDERRKENIKDFSCENSILDLPVKEFDLKSDGTHHIGCLAQDLQKICPELVKEDDDGYLAIEESKLVYLLLNEVKALKEEIEELKR